MGYMTTITIGNDAWDQIKKNPTQFIEAIEQGMHCIKCNTRSDKTINSYPVGNCANYVNVAESHHTDFPKLYLVWQNDMIDIDHIEECNFDNYKRQCLEIAYRIVTEAIDKYGDKKQ